MIKWSTTEYFDLPWRVRRSLYGTLVSEIMLQQTTVQTVLNHFDRFLDLYPNIDALSKTTEEEIIKAWKGLGYYRRARNLRSAAIDIQKKFNGKIPLNRKDLISINGIGDYTASAIISIGADQVALAVDANIERVFSRIFLLKTMKGRKLQDEISKKFLAEELFKFKTIKSYRELNEALMDLGRTTCKAKTVSCEICTIQKYCQAFLKDKPLNFPFEDKTVKATKKKTSPLKLLRVIVIKQSKKGSKILAYKKDKSEWLSGQYELPTWIIATTDKKLGQYPKLTVKNHKNINMEVLKTFKSSITRYSIQNSLIQMSPSEFKKHFPVEVKYLYQFVDLDFEKTNFAISVNKSLEKSKLA
jgi:A/G-specific adenine glycosylase